MRLFVVWALQLPVGWILHFCVKGRTLRYLYCLVTGVLGMLYFYGQDSLQVALMGGVTYALMLLVPREKVHIAVMVWVFGSLSYSHLMAVLYEFGSYKLNVTTNTMLLVCRLQALGYAYMDGGKDESKLSENQKRMRVVDLPSPLEFATFVFFMQSCALGVFFEFRDMKALLDCTHEYRDVPSPVFQSLRTFVEGLCCLGLFAVGSQYVYVDYLWTEEYAQQPLLYRLAYYQPAWHVKRYFYYLAFKMQTANMIACGLGYNGREEVAEGKVADPKNPDAKGAHKWDKIIGIYLFECETATSLAQVAKTWNYRIHVWLKHYVHERLGAPGEKPKAWHGVMTFIVSAFWHGFYPFYYVTFTYAAFTSELHKDFYIAGNLFKAIP